MNWRKINRATHRDLGYFFFAMCLIYGISGIALNHRHQWNPNYIVEQKNFQINVPAYFPGEDEIQSVRSILGQIDDDYQYRTHLMSENNLRIFIHGGTVNVNLSSGYGTLETIRKRPVFHQVNFLHYNTPKKLWTWYSDLFAAALIIMAISGLFVLPGKNSFARRGVYIVVSGIIIPVVFLLLYL